MEKEITIPKKYLKMVGTKQSFTGSLFGRNKIIVAPKDFDVIDIRMSLATIVNIKKMRFEHPAFELLLKDDTMKRAQWSRPFPIREIKLNKKL